MVSPDVAFQSLLGIQAKIILCEGTWLTDLSGTSRHDLQLHGIDLGKEHFRQDSRLSLREHDIRQPFPASWGWHNTFDLVHQRLLVWGIGATEWNNVVRNLADAVKPGGVLQLVEVEWVLSSYSNEQTQQKKLAKVQEWSTESSGMDVHIWKRFPEILKGLGFQDLESKTYSLGYGATSKRPEDRTWTAELLPQSFRHLARKISGTVTLIVHLNFIPSNTLLTPIAIGEGIPGVARSPEEYLAWLDELVVEMKQIGYTPNIKWLTARKV